MTTSAKTTLNPVLKQKFKKAAQALLESNALLICSGSGMTADCRISENMKFLNHEHFRILRNGVM